MYRKSHFYGENFRHFGGGLNELDETPTHWMPLPFPPSHTAECAHDSRSAEGTSDNPTADRKVDETPALGQPVDVSSGDIFATAHVACGVTYCELM